MDKPSTILQKENPIGIFDSGIGGLTVARAVNRMMPQENIIYFGDTAHLPYGDKSATSIQSYSIKICNFLLSQNCKVILIACNSASAAAYELVKEYVGSKAKVISVIEPTINYVKENYADLKIGLIGTKQTVFSNVYKKKIDDLNVGIELHSLATPLLVPMIEEGFFQGKISKDIISEYLLKPELATIQALILGCTHYPLIKDEINSFYENKVEVIDSSERVAKALKDYLVENNLENEMGNGHKTFYVSDYTHSFEASTTLFFGDEVNLELYPLWE